MKVPSFLTINPSFSSSRSPCINKTFASDLVLFTESSKTYVCYLDSLLKSVFLRNFFLNYSWTSFKRQALLSRFCFSLKTLKELDYSEAVSSVFSSFLSRLGEFGYMFRDGLRAKLGSPSSLNLIGSLFIILLDESSFLKGLSFIYLAMSSSVMGLSNSLFKLSYTSRPITDYICGVL